jgi:hypothetical protein
VRLKPVDASRDGFVAGRGALTLDASTGRRVLEMRDGAGAARAFAPDAVFGSDAGQAEVYEGAARALVAGVLEGTNASVIAYGQTGSGKTFTMLGDAASEQHKGVIPRALTDIFAAAAKLRATPGVRVFAVETAPSRARASARTAVLTLRPSLPHVSACMPSPLLSPPVTLPHFCRPLSTCARRTLKS